VLYPGGSKSVMVGAVQVDPMKPKLKPPGTKRLKLNCEIMFSISAFKYNLRRYVMAGQFPSCLAPTSCGARCSKVGPCRFAAE
jgi:hypothetical protein